MYIVALPTVIAEPSPTMMKSAIVFVALCMVALVHANAFNCQKRVWGPLTSYVIHTSGKPRGHEQNFAFKKGTLALSDKPGEYVDFWECEPPSDKYSGSTDKKMFGMLKSNQDPSMCVTSGRILRGVGQKSDGFDTAFRTIPKDASGDQVTWQKCATKESVTSRLQWFSVERSPKGGCASRVALEGHKSDNFLGLLQGDEKKASFDVIHPNQAWHSLAYLKNGDISNRCVQKCDRHDHECDEF